MHMNYFPFDGDGRTKTFPPTESVDLPGTPIPVTFSSARALLDKFTRLGSSTHSGQGNLVWVPVLWCRTHKCRYSVTTHYGGNDVWGYTVTLHA